MDAEPVTIPADLPAERAYEEFFLRYQGWPWFAVVEADGRFAGLAHRAARRARRADGASRRRRAGARRSLADARRPRRATDAPLEALLGSEPLRRARAR